VLAITSNGTPQKKEKKVKKAAEGGEGAG
jgi:hypothetical protein